MAGDLAIVILAAGLGKRLGGKSPKALIKTRHKALLEHILETAAALKPEHVVVVTGFGAAAVVELINGHCRLFRPGALVSAHQEQQLGTGDAVRAALPALRGFSGTVAIIYGDVPLLKAATLQQLYEQHHRDQAELSLLTLKGHYQNSFGRIIRTGGRVSDIVELKDCNSQQRLIDETNAGVYLVEMNSLPPALAALNNKNTQGEYYLTDIVKWYQQQGKLISDLVLFDPIEVLGVNTWEDMALINQALLEQERNTLISQGVLLEDPASFFMDPTVQVAPGAIIGPQVVLKGHTVIAEQVQLEGSTLLIDTTVQAGALLRFGVRAEKAQIGPRATVGPFAHLRPQAVLDEAVRVGNFVEIKQSHLKKGVKASHLTYLGDAVIEPGVNIGAGTITCNYDGYHKYPTTIAADAFIGSNSVLIAPVQVGAGAYVGAGSVIQGEVEADALVFTRPPRVTKPKWAAARRKKNQAAKLSNDQD